MISLTVKVSTENLQIEILIKNCCLFVAYHRLKKEENVSKTINRNLDIHMAHSFNYNFENLQSQSIKGYVRFSHI